MTTKITDRLLIATLAMVLALPAEARSRKVIRDFRKVNPCPSTGLTTGPCRGWRVDHVRPLCIASGLPAGGAIGDLDVISNLQWQEEHESYRKDVDERRLCAWLRKAKE